MTKSGHSISRMTPFSGVPEIPAVMKSNMPKGGVARPIIYRIDSLICEWDDLYAQRATSNE